MVYAPHRDVTLKASWGRSFKIPTLNQINQVQAGSLLPASLLRPSQALACLQGRRFSCWAAAIRICAPSVQQPGRLPSNFAPASSRTLR
ncbi:hypothetical protein ACFSLT_04150 [Novosphingobium resinovorum]